MKQEQIRQALNARPMAGPSGLWSLAKHASGGRLGFDPARNPSTNKKAACIEYIVSNFPAAEVEAAIVATAEGTPNNQPTTDTPKAPAMNRQLPFTTPAPAPAPAPKAAQAPAAAPQEAAGQLAALIAQLAQTNAAPIDAEAVRKIAQEAAAEALAKIGALPTRVEITKAGEAPRALDGVHHKAFPALLRALSARLHCWLYGHAGTGKTTAAANAAAALGLPFYSTGAVDSKHELVGFVDARGQAVATAFKCAFRDGGVFLFDEADASHPAALLAVNNALANGRFTFPGDDFETTKHADFVCLVGANTKGQGADANYNGRQRQDLAVMDRFILIDWQHDDALEIALSSNTDWALRVQAARRWAASAQIKGARITTRATIHGARMLAAGFSVQEADAATWGASLSAEQIEMARKSLPLWVAESVKREAA